MRFASALSTHSNSDQAAAECCRILTEQLTGPADWAMVFLSPHHTENAQQIAAAACDKLQTQRLLGCTAEAVAGVGREVEGAAAMTWLAAQTPEASIWPMRLEFEQAAEGGVFLGWPDDLPDPWPENAVLLLLGDPFSFPADRLLTRLSEDQPGAVVLGGMASGGHSPGENRLIVGRQTHSEGAAALLLSGGIRVSTVVSQGCRPIGSHFVVTKAEQNIIYELGGKPALSQFQSIYESLPTSEQQLLQKGLHLGRVVSEYQDQFAQGDFLVRNVIGADQQCGAIAVGDFVRPGQTVQFHLRDQTTADQELRQLLDAAKQAAAEENRTPAGALLFTCNGRGARLFDQPHHDACAIGEAFGEIPLAGFFAAGELGPITGKNFMHGFTASIGLFEEP